MCAEEMTPEDILEGIRTMRIRGAAEIGREAALAMRLFAERELETDIDRYLRKIEEFRAKALATRPTAVTLWSGLTRTLRGVSEAGSSEKVLEIIKENSEQFIDDSQSAIEQIAEMAARRIPENAVILTHCNSSAVVAAIAKAHEMGKVKMVIATESRPKLQGRITIKELSEKGV
ncbi:MAG: ribose 1,5-bisphosphate isomerase, partial [Thermoplasmata archaeon]|nr:ribose 1,5-bisphosphate isomerase [Thermoplasmata archaeon]